jgi:phage baseplate assembly protein W
MALIPENFTNVIDDNSDTIDIAPSKTWSIDFDNGTIGGFIDNGDALYQYIIKALMTERSKYVIYSDDYGNELQDLIGGDVTLALMDSEIPRMVYEALAYDDRIEDVTDINYTRDGDALYISFTVVAVNGETITVEEVAV